MPLDLAQSALLTIDIQRDTLDGEPFEVPGTSAIVPTVGELCAAYRDHLLPIVHIVRLYRADGSNAERSRQELVKGDVSLLRPGTAGRNLAAGVLGLPESELDDELLLDGGIQQLGGGEVVIYKPRWGAFYRTPLEAHLRATGATTLVFVGCNFPNCPRTSIYEASERDYQVVAVSDAISGLYDRGASELEGIGVRMATAEQVIAATRACA